MREPCDNPECDLYPYYGVAPHTHNLSGGSFIGSTVVDKKEDWGTNFVEDKDVPGCGAYYCPHCLKGKI